MSKIQVGIIMGSDSDLPTMEGAADMLDEFGVGYEMTVVSAHRTPQRMVEYATHAHKRGLEVIIAGAGGAAHLPGMVAAITPLPVIGVPVPLKHLDGLDSLLSIVQMPSGVPVATVAVGNSKNAGILAAQMVGIKEAAVREKVSKYKADLQSQVDDKIANVERWLQERKQ
jgi:5-(carboxyamino)imidazole ribonucleotide mutase